MSGFVFVLGMHRSGTSCLTGALERCGLFLGEVSREGHFNRSGNHELKEVWRLHDQILGLNRGSWSSLPKVWQVHPYHRTAITRIARQLASQRPCGIKDPRLLLFLDTWLKIVAPPHYFVGTFRHPLAVAQSLGNRNGISESRAINLWLRYNRLLVQRHQAKPFPIVEFDLRNVKTYRQTVASIAVSLGLRPNFSQIRTFVKPKLEHLHAHGMPVPVSCIDVYRYLQCHSFQPRTSKVRTPLRQSFSRRPVS